RLGGADPPAHALGEVREVGLARVVRERRAERALERGGFREPLAAGLAGRQVRVGGGALAGGERAVQDARDLLVGQVLHHASPPRSARRRLSSARARARRDITVPIGTLSTPAISSYDSSCTARSASTAWCSMDSSPKHARSRASRSPRAECSAGSAS